MEKNLKVSIIVPLQQHSYRTAKGLIHANLLDKYYATVYYKNAGIYRLLNFLLPAGISKRMRNRCDVEITPHIRKYAEFMGLIFLYAIRSPFVRNYSDKIRDLIIKKCGIQAAVDCTKREVDAVWSFDTMALYAFEKLKKRKS